MTRIRQFASTHRATLTKTGSYYLIHISVAAMVAYAVTGNRRHWANACAARVGWGDLRSTLTNWQR
jgi:hypothetical protein